ncbi:MAG: type II toxin-antitoxin system VapC family toxin [Proteobacteria bacterium]|nr:type II toxin-antitoxin system VapC family toxin [Pseudomonadota bacterium]
MIITLVDSNVLLDVLTEDQKWFDWSSAALARCADEGSLAINPLIYAEVSAGFEAVEDLQAALSPEVFHRVPLPWEAAFLAGKAFLRYRRSEGAKSSPLPDFYIGAHAAVSGLRLLTRDSARYSTYFPAVELLAP